MSEQLDLFSMMPVKRGDITKDKSVIGRELTWEEAEASIGRIVWVEYKGETFLYWKAMEPIEVEDDYYFRVVNGEYIKTPARRLIFKDKGFCAICNYWDDFKIYEMEGARS